MNFRHLAVLALAALAVPALAQNGSDGADRAHQAMALRWQHAPATEPLTGRASIALPPHTMYLDPAETAKLMTLTGNLPSAETYTVAAEDLSWFAVFDFDAMGYVKDDEKIDPDALLKAMRESQDKGNEERTAQHLDALTITGWSVPPHYDAASHNLEFGTRLSSATGDNVNYTTRLLGRRGVMNAVLVTSPATLDHDLPDFRRTLAGFAYKPDESYAAYKEGDKVSEYGLAALVAGGAAAAVLKGGLLKGLFVALAAFWKVIAVGVVAFFATIRRFFGRLFGRGEDLGPPPGPVE